MKSTRTLIFSALILLFSFESNTNFSQANLELNNQGTAMIQIETVKYGALAIDRTNGFYFGCSADCSTLTEAQNKAVDECNKKGGKCTVVLSYSGTSCAAYRYSTGKKIGLAFGWGLAKTKEEADVIAKREHLLRSFGMAAPNVIYNCNSANSGALKVIYNASSEIVTLPEDLEDY